MSAFYTLGYDYDTVMSMIMSDEKVSCSPRNNGTFPAMVAQLYNSAEL